MEDAKYINSCEHRLVCEPLTLTEVSTGIYTAKLPYPAITNKALTFIRTYNDEKSYLYNDADYTSVLNYSYRTVTGGMDELPIAGLIREIGITNYRFVSSTEIMFGEDPDDTTINRISYGQDLVPQPIILIDYYAQQSTCPLCAGTGAKQDIEYSGTGDIYRSEGNEKIAERVMKAILTKYGDSAEDILFGSALDNVIGSELDVTATTSIQKAVFDTITYLIELQDGLDLTAEETIAGIVSISIEQDADIPTKLNIRVVVADANGTEVPSVVSLRLS